MKVNFPKAKKKTMTINITEQEMAILERLANEKGLTKTALIRQALRLYQSVDEKLKEGDKNCLSCLLYNSKMLNKVP